MQVTLQRAGTVVGMDTLVADEDGNYLAFLIDASGRPVIQQPGDVLSANFGSGGSRSFTLVPLQVSVDLAANTVRGAGPAASLLGVAVYFDGPYEPLDTTVLTDQNGQWSLDLTTWMLGLQAGDPVDLVYTANGADATWLGAVAPVFWVRSADEYSTFAAKEENVVNNLVTGYAASYTPVMVTLKRNGGVLAFKTLEADYSGLLHGLSIRSQRPGGRHHAGRRRGGPECFGSARERDSPRDDGGRRQIRRHDHRYWPGKRCHGPQLGRI